MDFDPYSQIAEEDAFEHQYEDEMELLNELENNPSEQADGVRSSQRRRELFKDKSPSMSAAQDSSFIDFLEPNLLIDEEEEFMPIAKKPKMDMPWKKSHKMPTTLDDDFNHIKEKSLLEKTDDSDNMIKKILDFRKMKHHETEEFMHSRRNQAKGLQIRKVLPYPPIHSEFISATSTDGQRCYMRIRGDPKSVKRSEITRIINESSLLPQSVSEMRQEIQIKKSNKMLYDAHRLVKDIRGDNLSKETSEASVNLLADKENSREFHDAQKFTDFDPEISDSCKEIEKDLWLDRFAPTQYAHLLSEENVNRSLLKWLKMWDFVVFGRKVKKKEKPQPTNEGQNRLQKWDFDDRTDEYDRPIYKVALLHGPPGLGKTTLAHIIAKHAGYHVVEMNASDDRSAEVFGNKLAETTQMKSVLGQDERPNCLIIDEIDGAPQAAIGVLLNTINKSRYKSEKKSNLKKKGANNILLRPIICICNDLYVPSLRQLRQQSFVVNFPQTRSSILAARLAQLCRIQHLQCDMTTLLKLCEKTDNDIRSCVNTLQFVKASGKEKLNHSIVSAFQIGQKDQHKSLFKVWQEIFQRPKDIPAVKKPQYQNPQEIDSAVTALSARFYHIHHLAMANGEYEKTFQGVYENYLNMKFKDHNLECVLKAQEWIIFYDRLTHVNLHFQDWSVLKFYPYLFVVFHMLFSCNNVPKITFPAQAFENNKKLQRSENLLVEIFADMVPDTRCYNTPHIAVTDSIPYILSIISPSLRPVNSQLYSAAEKKLLASLVATMIAYHLSYKQIRNEDGRYDYVLEPNVCEVCDYSGTQDKVRLSYSTKQLIAKEVQMESMRRLEQAIYSNATNNDKIVLKSPKAPPKSIKEVKTLEKTLSQAQNPVEKPVIDFFSRFRKVKQVTPVSDSSKKSSVRDPGIGNSQIWYKFNEGYSNAVRQTVYVKDFL